jgi:hypothetical protein
MTKDLDAEQKYSRTAYADGPRLLADIGATHARFALETAPGVLRAVRCTPTWPTTPAPASTTPLLRWPIPSAAT